MTPHGRRMAELGLHPRLAHMLLRALPLGLGALACDLAALLAERDLLRGEAAVPDADLRLRLDALRGRDPGYPVDPGARRRTAAAAAQLRRELGIPPGEAGEAAACGLLLACAYPDRVAQGRAPGRFLLRNGRGAALTATQPLAGAPWLVAADLDDQGPEGRILLAAPLDPADLERHFGAELAAEDAVEWDAGARAVRARRRLRLGALILREAPLPDPDPAAVAGALLRGVATAGLEVLPWTRAARQVQQRILFLGRLFPGWPNVADPALAADLAGWLGPHLHGLRSQADLARLDLAAILLGRLRGEQRRELAALAPTHITVPSGARIPVDYSDPASPVLAVRLQELFGMGETPRIAGGRVPLTLHLLSPAHRPVQVTRDLASFWREAYFAVRKDLRGRYPKHDWPEDPLAATPSRRPRPR